MSRLREPRELLRHPTRAAVLAAAQERPGLRVAELQAALGVHRGTLLHHVRLLVRAGSLRVDTAGPAPRFYPAGVESRSLVETEASHPTYGRFLRALVESPVGLTRRELCAIGADLPVRTRNHALKRLAERGLVTPSPDGTLWRLSSENR